MKKIILLYMTLCVVLFVSAQSGVPNFGHHGAHGNKAKAPHNNARGTNNDEKSGRVVQPLLVASTTSYYNGSSFFTRDSSVSTYSHGRSYSVIYDEWLIDTTTNFVYDYFVPGFRYNSRGIQYYDAANRDTGSLQQTWDTASSTWVDNQREFVHFNAQNLIDTETYQRMTGGNWVSFFRYVDNYNGNNQMTQEFEFTWNAGTQSWVNAALDEYTYDVNGNRILDVYFYWNTTAGSFDSSLRDIYTYDGQRDQTSQTDNNYDSSNHIWTNSLMYVDSGFVATQTQKTIALFWNTGNNSYDTTSGWLYYYTPYNFYDHYISLSYSNHSLQLVNNSEWEQYYYALDTVTAISEVSPAGGTASVYPVPATNSVTVHLSWQKEQDFTIAIYDMVGQQLYHSPGLHGLEYNSTMSIQNLAAGNYLMQFKGENGEFVKQLVILPH